MGLKTRVIPVLLLRHGKLVQSRVFSRYSIIGDPWVAAKRMSSWSSDELIYLDISGGSLKECEHLERLKVLEKLAELTQVPMTFGGRIRDIRQARDILANGADKIAVNSLLSTNPQIVRDIAEAFGSQAVVGSIDVIEESASLSGDLADSRVFVPRHKVKDAVRAAVDLGCGEILMNSVARDGTGLGFDVELLDEASKAAEVPLIALGGAGQWGHFAEVLEKTEASAVAAANIFHHSENSVFNCKKFLIDRGLPVRLPPELMESNELV